MQFDSETGTFDQVMSSNALDNFVSSKNKKKYACSHCGGLDHRRNHCVSFITNNAGLESAKNLIPGNYSIHIIGGLHNNEYPEEKKSCEGKKGSDLNSPFVNSFFMHHKRSLRPYSDKKDYNRYGQIQCDDFVQSDLNEIYKETMTSNIRVAENVQSSLYQKVQVLTIDLNINPDALSQFLSRTILLNHDNLNFDDSDDHPELQTGNSKSSRNTSGNVDGGITVVTASATIMSDDSSENSSGSDSQSIKSNLSGYENDKYAITELLEPGDFVEVQRQKGPSTHERIEGQYGYICETGRLDNGHAYALIDNPWLQDHTRDDTTYFSSNPKYRVMKKWMGKFIKGYKHEPFRFANSFTLIPKQKKKFNGQLPEFLTNFQSGAQGFMDWLKLLRRYATNKNNVANIADVKTRYDNKELVKIMDELFEYEVNQMYKQMEEEMITSQQEIAENKAMLDRVSKSIDNLTTDSKNWYVANSHLLSLIRKHFVNGELYVDETDENVNTLRVVVRNASLTEELEFNSSSAKELLKEIHSSVVTELKKVDFQKAKVLYTLSDVPVPPKRRKNRLNTLDGKKLLDVAFDSVPLFDIFPQKKTNEFDVELTEAGRKLSCVKWIDIRKCQLFKEFVLSYKSNIFADTNATLGIINNVLLGSNEKDVLRFIFRYLSTEENRLVNRSLYQPGTNKDVMVKFKPNNGFIVEVSRRNLRTLRRHVWLNDEIINHYMFLLNKCQDIFCKKNVERRRCHFLNTYFFEKINPDSEFHDFKQAEKMRKRMTEPDIFKLDVLFIPINLGHIHWCGVSDEFEKKSIRVFDSHGGGYEPYARTVFEYLKEVHLKIYEQPLPEQNYWTISLSGNDVPRQKNGKVLYFISILFFPHCELYVTVVL